MILKKTNDSTSKRIAICIFLICSFFKCISQTTVKINRHKGVIFNNNIPLLFYNKYEERSNLKKGDLVRVEVILEKEFPLIGKARHRRQYVGFVNNSSQKIVLVNFIDLKGESKLKRKWKSELIIGSGDFYDKRTSLYYVNLETREVE